VWRCAECPSRAGTPTVLALGIVLHFPHVNLF